MPVITQKKKKNKNTFYTLSNLLLKIQFYKIQIKTIEKMIIVLFLHQNKAECNKPFFFVYVCHLLHYSGEIEKKNLQKY